MKVGRVKAVAKGCKTRSSTGDGRNGLMGYLRAGGVAILSPLPRGACKRAKVESVLLSSFAQGQALDSYGKMCWITGLFATLHHVRGYLRGHQMWRARMPHRRACAKQRSRLYLVLVALVLAACAGRATGRTNAPTTSRPHTPTPTTPL